MRNLLLVIASLMLVPASLTAQSAATFHVFPQIADGLFTDGSFYQSFLSVTATTDSLTSCDFKVNGLSPARTLGADTFNIQGTGAFNLVPTFGSLLPFGSGYATLSCNQPVTAFVAYLYLKGDGNVISGAAVFSSPASTRAQLVTNQSAGTRLALAIANDTTSAATYQVTLINPAGQTVASASVNVAAKSNVPKFIDELMTVPATFVGRVVISGTTPFSVIGLNFFGSIFISQPATVLP